METGSRTLFSRDTNNTAEIDYLRRLVHLFNIDEIMSWTERYLKNMAVIDDCQLTLVTSDPSHKNLRENEQIIRAERDQGSLEGSLEASILWHSAGDHQADIKAVETVLLCCEQRLKLLSYKRALEGHTNKQSDEKDSLVSLDIQSENRSFALGRAFELLDKSSQVARIGSWEANLSTASIYWSDMTREIHEVADNYVPDLETAINFYKEGRDRELITDLFQRCIETGEPYDEELRIITATGKEKWVRAIGLLDLSSGDELVTYGLFQDIDAQKRSEQALQMAHLQNTKLIQRLELATDTASIGVWEWNLQSNELVWDDTMYRIYDVDEDDFTSAYDAWASRVHPDDLATSEQALEDAIAGIKPFNTEFRVINKSGAVRTVKGNAVILRDQNNQPVNMVGINYDVTAERRYQADLEEQRQAADSANQAKSEFLATMSHEIRTPLNGIMGMLSLVVGEIEDDQQKNRLSIAKQSAESLLSIVNEILDFSKIESGKLTLETEPFDLCQLVEASCKSFALQSAQKSLELYIDTSAITQAIYQGDPGRLRQIIINLVGNAVKFTAKGHIKVKANIALKSPDTYRLDCYVEDTGIGIDDQSITQLFKAFTQADSGSSRHHGGTGLGLAITKTLCELMNGDIEVSSTLGHGSCFHFWVELAAPFSELKHIHRMNFSSLDVSLLGRSEQQTRNIESQLVSVGVGSVTTFKSAERVIEALQSPNHPQTDLLIIDNSLVSDYATLRVLTDALNQHNNQAVRCLIKTISDDLTAQDTDHRMNHFLLKPVSRYDLIDLLQSTLRQQQTAPAKHNQDDAQSDEQVIQLLRDAASNIHLKLLVVEDNRVNQMVISAMLDKFGLKAEVAANGQQAIDSLLASKSAPFDLVLMDCEMPVMDGLEATEKIRQGAAGHDYQTIPIVALTANAFAGTRERCFEAGMNEFITKPVRLGDLGRLLKQQLLPG